MTAGRRTSRTAVARAGFACGWRPLFRAPGLALLALVMPINLLLLLSLFALTGYQAPTAIVLDERTPHALAFVEALDRAHHSFALREMSLTDARQQLLEGRLVAIIEIPPGFDATIRSGRTAGVRLLLDNVNVDIAEDVRRAIPAASADFAQRAGFPGISVIADLRDVLPHDTDYTRYLGVSAVVLAAAVAGGLLGALVLAREHESGRARMLRLSSAQPWAYWWGMWAAVSAVASLTATVPLLVVGYGYDVAVRSWGLAVLTVVLVAACASALGAWLGALARRSLAVAPVVIGLGLALYLDSGALEPQRFDGPVLFAVAHLAPTYYGVGLIEDAMNGLVVTPEPRWLLVAALLVTTGVALRGLTTASRR